MMGCPMNNDEEDIVLARFRVVAEIFQFVTHLCFTWVAACESSYSILFYAIPCKLLVLMKS